MDLVTRIVWRTHFNERELKEIDWLRTYPGHGTDGHIRITIIQKMAQLLDAGLVPYRPKYQPDDESGT